jgi:hypothetical protein
VTEEALEFVVPELAVAWNVVVCVRPLLLYE